MAGLVVLDVHLKVIQEPPAVLGGAGEMDPGAASAAGSAGGLAGQPVLTTADLTQPHPSQTKRERAGALGA
jgi:hypothetical protein